VVVRELWSLGHLESKATEGSFYPLNAWGGEENDKKNPQALLSSGWGEGGDKKKSEVGAGGRTDGLEKKTRRKSDTDKLNQA